MECYVFNTGKEELRFASKEALMHHLSIRFSDSQEIENLKTKIESLSSQVKLKTKDDSGNDIHDYVKPNGSKVISVSDLIKKLIPDAFNIDKLAEKKVYEELGSVKVDEKDFAIKIKTKIKELTTAFTAIAARGTKFHEAAELFIKNYNTNNNYNISDAQRQLLSEGNINEGRFLTTMISFVSALKAKHGEDIIIMTERSFLAQTLDENIPEIAGTLDILVLTKDGVHIYDFKTSSKREEEWTEYKTNQIKYQQIIYSRILRQNGINVLSANYVPLFLDDLEFESTVNVETVTPNRIISNTIDTVITDSVAQVVKSKTDTTKKLLFEMFNIQPKQEDIVDEEKVNKLWDIVNSQPVSQNKKKQNVKYLTLWDEFGKSELITFDVFDENAVKTKIREKLKSYTDELNIYYSVINEYFQSSKEAKINGKSPKSFSPNQDINETINSFLDRYVNESGWSILPIENDLGIIVFYNDITKEYDVVALTSKNFNTVAKLNKGESLLGNVMFDHLAKTKYPKLMDNNVFMRESIKAISFVNENKIVSNGSKLGRVRVLNLQEGTFEMPQQLLKDNYNIVASEYNDSTNDAINGFNFESYSTFESLVNYVSDLIGNVKGSIVDTMQSLLDSKDLDLSDMNNIKQIKENLFKLKKELESKRSFSYKNETLLFMVSNAILQLERINQDVDIQDINEYFGEDTIYTTVPSEYKNNVMKALFKLYDAVAQKITKKYVEFQSRIKRSLDDYYSKVTNPLYLKTIGTTDKLFENLLETDENGNFTYNLKDPNDESLALHESKLIKDYMHFVKQLLTLNNIKLKEDENVVLRRLILIPESFLGDLMADPKTKIKEMFNSDNMLEKLKQAFRTRNPQAFSIEDSIMSTYATQLTNVKERQKILSEGTNFVKNIDVLLNQLAYREIRTHETNKIIPTIKALMSHLFLAQSQLGRDFPNVLEAAEKFIQTNIFDAESRAEVPAIEAISKTLRTFTTTTQLALSPAFFSSQHIQNMFTLMGDLFSNGIEGIGYGVKNFTKAIALTMGESVYYANGKTFDDLINEQYHVTGFDEKYIVNKMSTDSGRFLTRFTKWMTLSPDSTWRLIDWKARMLEDGTYEAHTIDEEGVMTYNPTLDKRFSLLFDEDADKTTAEYKRQKAYYNFLLKRLSEEDGINYGQITDTIPMLPRAYDQTLRNSMIEESDKKFGSQSERNKLIFSYGVWGSLLFQFKSWAVGKWNRWAGRNNQGMGTLQQVKFLKLDNGEEVPYYEGRSMEGIAQTIAWIFTDIIKNSGKGLSKMEDYRKANIVKGLTDLSFLMLGYLITALAKAELEEEKRLYGKTAQGRDWISYYAMVVMSQSNPLSIANTLFSVSNPVVSISILTKMFDNAFKDVVKISTSDNTDFKSLRLINSFGVTRAVRDVWNEFE